MGKQLSLYDKIENGASRQTWRQSKKISQFRQTYKLPLDMIEVMPKWNIRTSFDGIQELADDILANGQSEPLEGVLSENGKVFYLIHGERRLRAMKLLQKKNGFEEAVVAPMPANMKAKDMIVRMLSSGINKVLYQDVEIADGLMRLKTDFDLTDQQIADQIGKSRQYINNMMKLAKQPEEVKKKVTSGELTKTEVVVPMKEKKSDLTSGLTKPSIQPGLPVELKKGTDKTDALKAVNFDKEVNEQEKQINIIAKEVNKIEGLGKGLNEQGQKDLEKYLKVIRDNVTLLKEHYSKIKNRVVS